MQNEGKLNTIRKLCTDYVQYDIYEILIITAAHYLTTLWLNPWLDVRGQI